MTDDRLREPRHCEICSRYGLVIEAECLARETVEVRPGVWRDGHGPTLAVCGECLRQSADDGPGLVEVERE